MHTVHATNKTIFFDIVKLVFQSMITVIIESQTLEVTDSAGISSSRVMTFNLKPEKTNKVTLVNNQLQEMIDDNNDYDHLDDHNHPDDSDYDHLDHDGLCSLTIRCCTSLADGVIGICKQLFQGLDLIVY